MAVQRVDGSTRVIVTDDLGRPIDIINEFLGYLEDCGKSPNTIRAYAYDLQYLFRFLEIAGLLIDQFRPKHSVAFLKYLREDASRAARRRSAGEAVNASARQPLRLSDASVSRALAAVGVFYEFLIISDLYDSENPLLTIGAPRASGAPRPALGASSRQQPVRRRVRVPQVQRLPRPMSREHVQQFLATLPMLRDQAIFLLCVNGGLRPSEALTLRLPNVHYGLRRVVIGIANEDPRGLRTKSRTERIVDLHDESTLATISAYVMTERPQGAPTDLVFLVGRNGARRFEPVSYWAVNKLFARRLDDLGLRTPWTTPHALRHTHATELFEHGMRDMTLQKRLGHESPASTKIYTRVSDKTVRDDYVAALEALRPTEGQAP